MSKKHLVFIVNPNSGVDRQKEIQKSIDEHLDQHTYTYEIVHTGYAKHGIELARAAAKEGAYAVVAVGGDGSVNDIAKGLAGTETALAIIPKGSGNGMARTIGIPLNTNEAIAIINKGNMIKMDVGYANDHLFVSNAGVAFDALISKKFSKSKRRGFAVYSWLVTKYMWLYKERTFDITIDGQQLARRAFIVNVANMQQFGYNFKIAPSASWTDGMLDVVIIRRFPKILGGLLVARAMNGTITKSPYVEHYLAKTVTLTNPLLKLMQTDGDAHECTDRIEFRVAEGVQKVIVP
ncbi:MAG: diacylglycerol kinase family lipid kinase [Taibaiella sp.]|nr:diacylglycerol kinase family lipid kinase [Taibaiella sp.]